MTVPAQLDYHERAKAARARMLPANHVALMASARERERGALIADREAERVAAVVSQYRLATASLANPKMQVSRIKRDIARKHHVTVAAIDSARRDAPVVRARQEALWLARTKTNLSLHQLGEQFNRDHTSVLWSIRQHEARMAGTSISRIKGAAKPSLATLPQGGQGA
jgi:chromosomal replication initiation ATPase DnaA